MDHIPKDSINQNPVKKEDTEDSDIVKAFKIMAKRVKHVDIGTDKGLAEVNEYGDAFSKWY